MSDGIIKKSARNTPSDNVTEDVRAAAAAMGSGHNDSTQPSSETPRGPNKAEQPKPLVYNPTPFVWRDPTTMPRRQFLYGTHYCRGYVSATIAPPGVGKSSKALVDAVAMATGRSLLGAMPTEPLTVWYVNLEDPREEIERRVLAICLHYGIKPHELQGRLFFDGREIEIVIAHQTRDGAKIAAPVVHALVAALTARNVDVFVLDPFISAHRVSENDNPALDAVVKTLGRQVAGVTNCAIELVHHTRKMLEGEEVEVHHGRGGSALIGGVRSMQVINRMSENEGKKSGVGEKYRSYFRVDNGKANLAPPSRKADWFKLESVALGNGSDCLLDDQDYVGVVTAWEWPNPFDDVTAADLRAVQAHVREGQWRESSQSPDWVGRAVAKVLELDVEDEADKTKIKGLLKTWIKKGMFRVVEGEDEKRNKRKFVVVGEPAND
jgi:hypothetical protein